MNQCKALNFQIVEEEPVNAKLDFQGEIIQGSGGIEYETDPTVPAWAKEPTKPSYTASEVGAVPETRKIANIDLSDDITVEELQNNLKNGFVRRLNRYPNQHTKGVTGEIVISPKHPRQGEDYEDWGDPIDYDSLPLVLVRCVKGNYSNGMGSYINDWEELGYVFNSQKIAGIDLKDNITADELKEALGIDLSEYVEKTTKIAGLTLSSDILAEDLAEALSVANVVVETKAPTPNNSDENTFWIDTTTNSLYYCDKRTLSGYNWIEIASGGGGTFEETDPTVPDWAKEDKPPTYTAEDVGAVPTTRKIADIDLADDITVKEMRESLETYPLLISQTSINTKTEGEKGQLGVYPYKDNEWYIVFCKGKSGDAYQWQTIGHLTKSDIVTSLANANSDTKVPSAKLFKDTITSMIAKSDIADELKYDEYGDLSNGNKIASIKCVHDSINFMAEEVGKEIELKADKSYVDEVFAIYDNNILAILGGDENVE